MRAPAWTFCGVALGLAVTVAADGTPEPIPATTIVAVVLDTSGSLTPSDLALARRLATGLLSHLPEGGRMALFTFDDQSRNVLPLSSEADRVEAALDGISRSGSYTALHDALYDSTRYLSEVAARRRAVVILTDGRDENSALELEDGLAVARDRGIPVFTIGVGRRIDEHTLRRIAKLTSGRYVSGQEADAATIAGWIEELPEAEPAPTPEPAAPSPTPLPAEPRAGPWFLGLLWWLLGSALLLASVALFLRARRAPPPRRVAPLATSGTDAGATVVARVSDASPVDRTVVLSGSPALVIRSGGRAGETVRLGLGSATSLGRGPANDIVVADESVSGQHCRIRPEGGRFTLHDLESTNGTFVNDRRVGRHVLAEGDVIRIGETSLEFQMLRQ
jgi:hypothetical protein